MISTTFNITTITTTQRSTISEVSWVEPVFCLDWQRNFYPLFWVHGDEDDGNKSYQEDLNTAIQKTQRNKLRSAEKRTQKHAKISNITVFSATKDFLFAQLCESEAIPHLSGC